MLSEEKLNKILAIFVFIASIFVYLKTIAPTTSFWDCGEFIACSYILGVPHPPGAPLYILLGRIFSMIPFAQDIGLRVNVISALSTGLTVMFLYLIIVRLVKMWRGATETVVDRIVVFSGAVIGSMFFAFTETLWFNAVEAEVYAISVMMTAMVFWLILVWHEKADDPQSDRYLLMIAYLIGLATSVHLLSILALPAVALVIYFRKSELSLKTFISFGVIFILAFISVYPGTVKWLPNLAHDLSAWLFVIVPLALVVGIYYAVKSNHRIATIALSSFLLILLAASTYLAIYIRSNLDPAIDENDPETLDKMVSYLNREQYGDWSYVDRRAPLWDYQIEKMYLRYFGWQFIGKGTTLGEDSRIVENYSLNGLFAIPFLIGLIGMFAHFRKDWKHASTVMVLFIMTGVAIVLYLNQEDPQPRERDYVYVGSFFAFAVWIGIGVTTVLEWLKDTTKEMKSLQKPVLIAAAAILAFVLPINSLALNYESNDRTGNYVAYDYSYNILQSCEEDAILFTNGDNDTFPLWFLQFVYNIRRDVRVVNLSLLNTSWYIKQLKSEPPEVPISLSDAAIEEIAPRMLPPEDKRLVRIQVPKEVYIRDMEEVSERKSLITEEIEAPEISFTLKPTLIGKAIRVQDLMVLNIITANRFRRPVYFALTVSRDNQLNLFDYLRMDGLVFKLVTYTGERISPSKLHTNLFNKFQYRNLNNKDVYYNENIKGLLRNYHGAFFSLAQFYGREKMFDMMDSTFQKLNEVMPSDVIPMRDDLKYNIGYMYYQAGKKDEFKKQIESILDHGNPSYEDRIRYAYIFNQLFEEKERAESLVKGVLDENPGYGQAYYWLLNFYSTEKRYEDGISLLSKWLAMNPEDKTAQSQIQKFRELMARDSTVSDSVK